MLHNVCIYMCGHVLRLCASASGCVWGVVRGLHHECKCANCASQYTSVTDIIIKYYSGGGRYNHMSPSVTTIQFMSTPLIISWLAYSLSLYLSPSFAPAFVFPYPSHPHLPHNNLAVSTPFFDLCIIEFFVFQLYLIYCFLRHFWTVFCSFLLYNFILLLHWLPFWGWPFIL